MLNRLKIKKWEKLPPVVKHMFKGNHPDEQMIQSLKNIGYHATKQDIQRLRSEGILHKEL